MNFKHLFLAILLLCPAISPATQTLEEKLADLRNGKSMNLNKEELVVLLGKHQVDVLLQAKTIQEIEKTKEEELKNIIGGALVLGSFVGGICGGLTILIMV